MKAAQLERLHEHLQRLRVFKSRERLEAVLQEATAKELTYADFTMRTHLARFPFVKGLDAFDFIYQPSLDKKQVQTPGELPLRGARAEPRRPRPARCREEPLGRRLGPQGHRARLPGLFTTAAALITTLTKAGTGDRLDEKLKLYTAPVCSSSMRSGTCPDGGSDPE